MQVAFLENAAASREDWLARCRAGDVAAWRQLYEQHFPMVHRVAVRMGAAPRDVPDICQEVFFRAYKGLRSFRAEAGLSTWLYRITLNEVWRAGRQAGLRRALDVLLLREAGPAPAAAPGPHEAVVQAEAARELHAVLDRMKPKQRAVFVLYELEELSTEEIARVLECPVETAKSRLRLARADFDRLRRQREAVRSGACEGGSP